ncbi:MAG: hypothetical protein NVSMB6_10440 [Burkholderiaceae bacterium]
MLAWGVLLIHPADNLIRPLVVSSTTQASFLMVMFGIFGGIAAFGSIGLFIGPAMLAVALTGWSELVATVRTISKKDGPMSD